MNGKELLLSIRNLEDSVIAKIPVIACTANAMKEDINAYIELGFDAVLSKPVSLEDLNEVFLQLGL